MTIRKLDKVILRDGSSGLTLETFETPISKVYKIKRLDNNAVEYVDGNNVFLKSRHFNNFVSDVIRFLRFGRSMSAPPNDC